MFDLPIDEEVAGVGERGLPLPLHQARVPAHVIDVQVRADHEIDRCGIDPLVFELPGPWIKGVTLSDVHQIAHWLLGRFGPDVNIANVAPDDVLKLEASRLNLGVNAGGTYSAND